jgi:hypothetical protein
MVETITPVVHGGSRKRWAAVLGLHVLGATLSAAALGAALGALGTVLGAPWGAAGAVIVTLLAVLYLSREAFGVQVPIPDARRQVPQWWREAFSPGTTGFLYGLGLGVGFATHLGHGTLVVVAAVSMAGGDPLLGAVALAAFGVARSTGVAVTWTATDRPASARLAQALERLGAGAGPRLANGLALAGLAVAAAFAADAAAIGDPSAVPAVILAAVFAWAAGAKTIRPRVWRRALDAHALPPTVGGAAIVLVPLAEGAVTVLVLAGSVHVAAGLALVLLAGFSVELLRLRSRLGDRAPCGCFGSSRTRSIRLLLTRNAILAVVAAAALAGPERLRGIRVPGGGEILPFALAAAGIVTAAVLTRRAVLLLREARPLVER